MALPPGPAYLIRQTPRLLGPSILAYVLLSRFDLTPAWITTLAAISALPALLAVQMFWQDWKNERDRRQLGANRIPKVKDGGFMGIKLIRTLLKNFKTCYPSDFYGDLPRIYGQVFNYRLMFRNVIVTFEPAHIKAVLATQFEYFEKGIEFHTIMYPLLGDGIFNSDGETWKFHRNLTRPFFTRNRINDFEIFARYTDKALAVTEPRLREGHPIEFQDMIGRFTLDVASTFLLGKDMDSLSSPLPYPMTSRMASASTESTTPADAFVSSFATAQKIVSKRQLNGQSWPLAEFWKDKMPEHKRVMDAFVRPVIEAALSRKQKRKESGHAESTVEALTLIDELVQQTDDVTLIRDEILNILVAGKDTTAATLTFAVYMLAEHPHVLTKLRQEIIDRVGSNRNPTYEDVKDMKYLRAVINETLRMYPPVPFDVRAATKSTTWPSTKLGGNPLFVQSGAVIVYSVFIMHRRKDLWGPTALDFDPDRFIDSRLQQYLVPNPFIFVPFNAGPRICLGQQFAYNQVSFFLIRLLQTYSNITLDLDARPESTRPPEEWKTREGQQAKEKIRMDSHVTLFVKDALWLKMEEAKDGA